MLTIKMSTVNQVITKKFYAKCKVRNKNSLCTTDVNFNLWCENYFLKNYKRLS